MPNPVASTVLITGAAQGIGRHLAEAFYRRGWCVVATDRRAPTLPPDWDAARALALPLDVTDPAAWEQAWVTTQARFGVPEVLVNNAGVIAPGFATELTVADIDQQVAVNLRGVLYGARLAARHMTARGRGHLINLASLAGVAPIHGLAVYSATKFAVRGFTLAVAYELAQRGVAASVICPDLVHTPMLTQQLDYPAAALSFSGARPLTVQHIEQAVFFNALQRRQVEILLPASRGWLARLGNLWPRLGRVLTARLMAKGQRAQQSYRGAA